MSSSHGDWANAVRYFHGKGAAPRRTIHGPVFAIAVFFLSALTILALIVEFS